MYKAVEIALAEEGYLEKKSNKNLDSKTDNAGFANYTKYARDLDALGDFYNGPKNGYPWCECFVDWCFYKAYGKDLALKMLYQPLKSAGAGCTQSAQYYKKNGAFYNTPKEGDQIFFTWGSDVEHTGIVWKVTSTTVYTIEGNTSGKSGLEANGGGVFKKEYSRTSSVIYGYGRPNYSLAGDKDTTPAPTPTPTPTPTPKPSTGGVNVTLSTITFGMAGAQVKSVQALLIKKFGISCGVYGADGDFGNATLSAVKKFQQQQKLAVDGIVGQETWKKLLGV